MLQKRKPFVFAKGKDKDLKMKFICSKDKNGNEITINANHILFICPTIKERLASVHLINGEIIILECKYDYMTQWLNAEDFFHKIPVKIAYITTNEKPSKAASCYRTQNNRL